MALVMIVLVLCRNVRTIKSEFKKNGAVSKIDFSRKKDRYEMVSKPED